MWVGALKRALGKSQTVESRRQKAQSGDDSEGNVCPIGSEQDEEFAHEISKPWEPKRSHGKNQPGSTQRRHGLPQAAHRRNFARMHSFLQQTGKNEQRARADSVADHLNNGAFKRDLISGEDTEQHESHVADAGIGNKAFEIGLADSEYGAIEISDHTNGH